MIKQLFKIVWNRKRANFLIMIEILISFLVVFFVIIPVIYFLDLYTHPLGFTYKDVWAISIDPPADLYEVIKQLTQTAKDFPEIEAFAVTSTIPFDKASRPLLFVNGGFTDYVTKPVRTSYVSDDLPQVLGIKLLEGRWFNKEYDGSDRNIVVINQKLSRELYGNESPIGKIIENRYKIIGMVSDFRDFGELTYLENYMFERIPLTSMDVGTRPTLSRHISLIVKLRPGTSVAFEEKLVKTFVSKGWYFNVQALEDIRYQRLKETITPLLAASLVAVFLMIMVGLGLSGVLWKNVTQRTKEIGLRRANGATVGDIYYQILGELSVITLIALFIGTLITTQLIPLPTYLRSVLYFVKFLGVLYFVNVKVFIITLFISWGIIGVLTLICGLYPSSLAAKIPPAEALHYE